MRSKFYSASKIRKPFWYFWYAFKLLIESRIFDIPSIFFILSEFESYKDFDRLNVTLKEKIIQISTLNLGVTYDIIILTLWQVLEKTEKRLELLSFRFLQECPCPKKPEIGMRGTTKFYLIYLRYGRNYWRINITITVAISDVFARYFSFNAKCKYRIFYFFFKNYFYFNEYFWHLFFVVMNIYFKNFEI